MWRDPIGKVTFYRLRNCVRERCQGLGLRRDSTAARIVPRGDKNACILIALDFESYHIHRLILSIVNTKRVFQSTFVRSIEFVAEDKPGFWGVRGYSNTADPWTEDRFS